MNKRTKITYSLLFASLIIISNYTVQFPINEWLTYGAILFPFTFLLTDIMGEKYQKDEILQVVRNGVLLAIIPTIMISELRIAFASIMSFLIVQQLDVRIFHYLKRKHEKHWWLRNNASTITSQFFDTVIFFTVAFAFIMPPEQIVKLIIGDYSVKIVLALLDTPLFYLFGIKLKNIKLPYHL